MSILCAYRYGIVGGVSTQFLLRQKVLRSAGIDCHLFFSQDNGLRAVLDEREGVHFGAEISLRRLVRRLKPEVAVTVDSPELIDALQPWLHRPRLYLDVHTTTSLGLSYLLDLPVEALTGILAPTEYSGNLIRKRLPDSDPIVVPNLVDSKLSRTEHVDQKPSDSKPEFVWVGKLDEHKNWRMALVWASILRDLFGTLRMTVIGGYTAPAQRVEEFLRFSDELGLGGILRWIDRIGNSEVTAIYRAAAESGGAMLVTSRDESFGMAIAEALLCGCPVIANDLPVFREVFPDSPLFQRVDVWEPQAFLSAIQRLRSGQDTAEVKRVRAHLLTHYGPDAFLASVAPILEQRKT